MGSPNTIHEDIIVLMVNDETVLLLPSARQQKGNWSTFVWLFLEHRDGKQPLVAIRPLRNNETRAGHTNIPAKGKRMTDGL